MDKSLPNYEAAMRDAREYLRRRDLSSQDEIPLYFAWQRLYAAANANLSTDFLEETREELKARQEARLVPRRGIPPPLFTSFDKEHRISTQASAFLRSGSSSDAAIEMMARRYRREAEKLRSSREKLMSSLDDAEKRMNKNKRRQKTPEQEVEELLGSIERPGLSPTSSDLLSSDDTGKRLKKSKHKEVEELLEGFERAGGSPTNSDLLSDKTGKRKLAGAMGKRTKKAIGRANFDTESDDPVGKVDPSQLNAHGSAIRGKIGVTSKAGVTVTSKNAFPSELRAGKNAAKAAELRRSSLSKENPAAIPSYANVGDVAAFAAHVDWRMPPNIDGIATSPDLLQNKAGLYSTGIAKPARGSDTMRGAGPTTKSTKRTSGANELRGSGPVEGEEGDVTFDTSLASSDLEDNDDFDPDASLGEGGARVSPMNKSRTKPKGAVGGASDRMKSNQGQINPSNTVSVSDIEHDPSRVSSDTDPGSLNPQKRVSNKNVRGSEFRDKLLQLSHAVGDMKVKIQGKQIEVTFKGEINNDTGEDDSKRGDQVLASSTKSKQPSVVQKIIDTTREMEGASDEAADQQDSTHGANQAKGVRFADEASKKHNDTYNKNQLDSDKQTSRGERGLGASANASSMQHGDHRQQVGSGNASENAFDRSGSAKGSIEVGDDSGEATEADPSRARSRTSNTPQQEADGEKAAEHGDEAFDDGDFQATANSGSNRAGFQGTGRRHENEETPLGRSLSNKSRQQRIDEEDSATHGSEVDGSFREKVSSKSDRVDVQDSNKGAGSSRAQGHPSKTRQQRTDAEQMDKHSDEMHRTDDEFQDNAIPCNRSGELQLNAEQYENEGTQQGRKNANEAQQQRIDGESLARRDGEADKGPNSRSNSAELPGATGTNEDTEDPQERNRVNKKQPQQLDDEEIGASARSSNADLQSATRINEDEEIPRGRGHSNKSQQQRTDSEKAAKTSGKTRLDDVHPTATGIANPRNDRTNEDTNSRNGQQENCRSQSRDDREQVKQHKGSIHNTADDFQDPNAGKRKVAKHGNEGHLDEDANFIGNRATQQVGEHQEKRQQPSRDSREQLKQDTDRARSTVNDSKDAGVGRKNDTRFDSSPSSELGHVRGKGANDEQIEGFGSADDKRLDSSPSQDRSSAGGHAYTGDDFEEQVEAGKADVDRKSGKRLEPSRHHSHTSGRGRAHDMVPLNDERIDADSAAVRSTKSERRQRSNTSRHAVDAGVSRNLESSHHHSLTPKRASVQKLDDFDKRRGADSDESDETNGRMSSEQRSRGRQDKQQTSQRQSRTNKDNNSTTRELESDRSKRASNITKQESNTAKRDTSGELSEQRTTTRAEKTLRLPREASDGVSSRERGDKPTLKALHYHRKKQQSSRRSRNQREESTLSDLDDDEDLSDGPDTPDAKRHHRMHGERKVSRGVSDVHDYEKRKSQNRRLLSRLNSSRKLNQRSIRLLDSESDSDDESANNYDISDEEHDLDRHHRSQSADHRYSTRNPELQSRSKRYSTRIRDQYLSSLMDSPPKKSKTAIRPERQSKVQSESRSRVTAKKPYELPKGIVWPPGMEEECVARLGIDGHHPIAPPGLEHLVTEEQWGDYWMWLHWYSSWQMWYVKNGMKPKSKRKSGNERRRHAEIDESSDFDAKHYDKHDSRNANWWVDIKQNKRHYRRDRYD